jgi:hypothetical protein
MTSALAVTVTAITDSTTERDGQLMSNSLLSLAGVEGGT